MSRTSFETVEINKKQVENDFWYWILFWFRI